MYYRIKFIELDGTIQNYETKNKVETRKWIENNRNYVSIESITKVTKKKEVNVNELFLIRTEKLIKEESYNYIHEKELENIVTGLWEEIYNHKPFTPYNKEYLNTIYTDLFNLDRENHWIIQQASEIDYDLWYRADNEHYIISMLIARVFAYIEEPFGFIENLYKPFTSKEKARFEKKWGNR